MKNRLLISAVSHAQSCLIYTTSSSCLGGAHTVCRYHKQQSIALNYQLPELERIADVEDLPEPPRLYWSRAANMLNPGLLLERELSGGCNGSCLQRPQRPAHVQERQQKAERFGACMVLIEISHTAARTM
jgi:hypothetical protein